MTEHETPPEQDGPVADPGERTVTRIGGTTAGEPGDRITTGVLAADSTTRTQLSRRRRWLVGGAVLGVVVVLAFVLGATLAADIAQERAREEATLAGAEAAFAEAVVGRAEDYERPALQVGIDAPVLRAALEDHLVVTERVPEELASTVERTSSSLVASADELAGLVARPLPTADPLVEPTDRDAVLVELEQLRVDADALVEELRATGTAVGPWSAAVQRLDAALAAHTATVEARPTTTDPDELVAGWRSELGPLAELEAAAVEAQDVPGLRPWAVAHRRYARANEAFVEQAVELLEAGRLEEYNALFLDTFGTDDPFGFQAAARSGATRALESTPIADVAALEERATVVVTTVADVERTVARRFADG